MNLVSLWINKGSYLISSPAFFLFTEVKHKTKRNVYRVLICCCHALKKKTKCGILLLILNGGYLLHEKRPTCYYLISKLNGKDADKLNCVLSSSIFCYLDFKFP